MALDRRPIALGGLEPPADEPVPVPRPANVPVRLAHYASTSPVSLAHIVESGPAAGTPESMVALGSVVVEIDDVAYSASAVSVHQRRSADFGGSSYMSTGSHVPYGLTRVFVAFNIAAAFSNELVTKAGSLCRVRIVPMLDPAVEMVLASAQIAFPPEAGTRLEFRS